MRRKASLSGIFPQSSAATQESKLSGSGTRPASRLSLSLPFPLSPTQRPSDELSASSINAAESNSGAALDRAVASVLSPRASSSYISIAPRKTSLLDCEFMQGHMVIHAKKPKKKLFCLNRTYFVVADAAKAELEVFTNESRAERVYVFSLGGANVDFETDQVSHAVRAKCFCLNVQSWRKRGVDYLRPQGFVFYQEDQALMMIWVKSIHVAIRKANAVKDAEHHHFRLSESSTVGGDESDVTESDRAVDRETEPDDTDPDIHSRVRQETRRPTSLPTSSSTEASTPVVVTLPAPRSPRRTRGLSRRRAAVDPMTGAAHSATSPSGGLKSHHFPRLNTMLATMKSAGHHSIYNSVDGQKPEKAQSHTSGSKLKPSSPFSPGIMSSLHMPRVKSSSSRHVADIASPPPAGKRLSDPFQIRKKDDPLFGGFSPFSSRGSRSAPSQAKTLATGATAEPPSLAHDEAVWATTEDESATISSCDLAPEWRMSNLLARLVFLLASCFGGACQFSVFLPIALAGVFVFLNDKHADEFAGAAAAACWVFAAGYVQASLGLCSIAALVYGWSYADFRTSQRLRRQRITEKLLQEESESFAHVQFPNWVVRPDTDRVDWLNKVLSKGWPYMKLAIRNSILDNLNPLLESSRPAFMSSLSLVRVDLGAKVPVITGVKFVSANVKTEEVTLDVDVRIMSDETLTAELRMVSNLGAAAVVSLRDLFLAGTLRVTLTPLAVYWPCFSALSLSFTERPVVDFSLTAAKINISNVPFASEWLHTFLHDLLLGYFVWPKVLHIPLWDENGTTAASTP